MRERAAKCRAAQRAGVGARIRGSWRRTGRWKGLHDRQQADCQPPSGCPSLLSRLLVPKMCMLAYIHVHTYINLYTSQTIHTCLSTNMHAYIHTNMHTYIHTYIYSYINTYINTSIYLWMCAYTYISLHIYTYICIHVLTYTCLYL